MLCPSFRHLEIMPVTLSPSLPLRFAQGFGSLKGKLREGPVSMGREILPLRYAQGSGSCAQDDRTRFDCYRALRIPRMDETLLSYKEDFHVNNERERGLYLLT